MRVFVVLISILLIGVVSLQLYRLAGQRRELGDRVTKIGGEVNTLEVENKKLAGDLDYLSHAENLVKELKSLFNYRKPGEELFIFVPEQGTTTKATTTR